ncbi:uncharacterized protein LOC119073398 [Bradysia coprophila]|uniref:uncharacterized protein LOC119073398 n=1 Tax=Bradysia coprophila TaxID=38358 RepID=UPI00187D9B3A|nr:uncharacterized protein LOC119073398 [Bradysia coprophila]
MEDNDKKIFKEVVENIFLRWTALKLAVEHGMGGKTGQQTAVESMNYVYEYCIGNDNVTQSEIQEVLEDIMDEEFDTICEDNSPAEISSMLVTYLKMILAKQYDTVRTEVSAMPQCQTQWLNPNFKLEYKKDSDSGSSDDEDEEMEVCTDTDVQGASRTNAPITDEDGWTTVTSKRR